MVHNQGYVFDQFFLSQRYPLEIRPKPHTPIIFFEYVATQRSCGDTCQTWTRYIHTRYIMPDTYEKKWGNLPSEEIGGVTPTTVEYVWTSRRRLSERLRKLHSVNALEILQSYTRSSINIYFNYSKLKTKHTNTQTHKIDCNLYKRIVCSSKGFWKRWSP